MSLLSGLAVYLVLCGAGRCDVGLDAPWLLSGEVLSVGVFLRIFLDASAVDVLQFHDVGRLCQHRCHQDRR